MFATVSQHFALFPYNPHDHPPLQSLFRRTSASGSASSSFSSTYVPNLVRADLDSFWEPGELEAYPAPALPAALLCPQPHPQ